MSALTSRIDNGNFKSANAASPTQRHSKLVLMPAD